MKQIIKLCKYLKEIFWRTSTSSNKLAKSSGGFISVDREEALIKNSATIRNMTLPTYNHGIITGSTEKAVEITREEFKSVLKKWKIKNF